MDYRSLKRKYIRNVLILTAIFGAFLITTGIGVATAFGGGEAPGPGAAASQPAGQTAAPARWDLSIAISIAIGLPCLAAGYAVGQVGAAALGAASEKPEMLIRSLLYVALAEGIAIYGLLVAVLLYLKL